MPQKKGISFGFEKAQILRGIQLGCCAYCGATMRFGKLKRRETLPLLTLDHVYPRSSATGATDEITNLLAVCRPCNMAKGDHWPTKEQIEKLKNVAPIAKQMWDAR